MNIYYIVYVILHTLLMMIVMEMNAWVVLYVLFGVTLGYYYNLTQ